MIRNAKIVDNKFENNFKSNILNSKNYQEVFNLDLLSKNASIKKTIQF